MKIVMIALIPLFFISAISVAAAGVPEYAKWGVIAVQETQKRYNAQILDYKHIGRADFSPKIAEERFKLWLRNKQGKEFGLYVSIQFDPTTDTIRTIRFSETGR